MSAGIGPFELLILVGVGFVGVFLLAMCLAAWSTPHGRRRNHHEDYSGDASSDAGWSWHSSATHHSGSASWFDSGSSHDSGGSSDSGSGCDSSGCDSSGGDCGGGDSGGGCSSGD